MTVRAVVLVCLLAAGAAASGTEAVAASWAPGEVIVRFKPGVDGPDRSAVRRAQGAGVERVLPLARTQVLDLPSGVPVASAVRRLERDPRVEWAEPNYRVRARAWTPGDLFDLQWALHNTGWPGGEEDADIDALEAWDVLSASPAVTVAVVDTGVDLDHPELAGRIAADLTGTDLVDGDDDPDDPSGHGTHVAGTIGAGGDDGAGVTGVSHDVRILPVRVLDEDGSAWDDDIVEAFHLAAEKGAAIVNASFGGSGSFPKSIRTAISEHPDVLFVVAAGNEGSDNDEVGDWPCNYKPPAGKPDNVICVAASDPGDLPADFTNFGAVHVDLAAPGVDIQSTWPGELYASSDGTSMATPHVTGAAALVLAQSQAEGSPLDAAGIRQRLLDTVDRSACWTGLTATGGRLNLGRALGADEELLGPGPTATACPIDPEEFRAGHTGDGGADDGGEEPDPPAPPWQPPTPPPVTVEPPAGGSGDREPSRSDDTEGARVDATAPRVRISAARTRSARALLRSGMRARLRCNEGCRLRADLLVGRNTARKLGISGRRFGSRYVLLGRSRARLGRAGTKTLTTRVARRSRAGLQRARRVRLVLRVVSIDASGNARVTTRSLVVRR